MGMEIVARVLIAVLILLICVWLYDLWVQGRRHKEFINMEKSHLKKMAEVYAPNEYRERGGYLKADKNVKKAKDDDI